MAEDAVCSLKDQDILQVIFALAKAGHQQHIPEIGKRLRHERGYIPGDCAHTLECFTAAVVSLSANTSSSSSLFLQTP